MMQAEQVQSAECKDFKTCTKCKKKLPATTEYFYFHKSNNRLMGMCKTCHYEDQRKRREAKRQKIQDAEYKTCKRCNETYQNTDEHFYYNNKRRNILNNICKTCELEARSEGNKNRSCNPEKQDRLPSNIIPMAEQKPPENPVFKLFRDWNKKTATDAITFQNMPQVLEDQEGIAMLYKTIEEIQKILRRG